MPSGIKIEGLANLNKMIEQLPVKVQKSVDRELTDGANKIAKLAKQLAPNYEGRLIQSISADTNTPLHKEVVANVFYAPYIEFGTGKKVDTRGYDDIAAQFRNQPKRGNFEDMVKALTEWVRKKGLAGTYSVKTQRRTGNKANRANEDRQVAYIIALSILKNGLKPHPFFFKAYDAYKEQIKTNIDKAIGG